MAKVTRWRFAQMLVEAGIMTQEEIDETRRVVIDSGTEEDSGVKVYIERFVDGEALLKLTPFIKDLMDDGS